MSITAGITAAKASLESDLRRQLDDRETRKALDADMEFRTDGDFWVRKSEIDKTLIPYCPACWGKDGKLVAMAPYSNPGIFRCPLHEKAVYPTSVYVEWLNKQPKRTVGTGVVGRPWIDLDRRF